MDPAISLYRVIHQVAEQFFGNIQLIELKESYVKATEKRLSEGLNTLQISRDNGNIHIEKDGKSVLAYFKMLKCIEGHQLSLCSFSAHPEKDVQLLHLKEVKERLEEF